MPQLMKQTRKDSALENIMASYFDERGITLTEHEEEKKQQYEAAFTMLVDDASIINTVLKLEQIYNVSKATAYRIIANAETIFGSVKKFNREAWRYIQIERKRQIIALALVENNLELAAKLERDIDNLIGFDKEEATFNPDKLKAQKNEITVPKSMEKLIMDLLSKGSVDLNSMPAEDIPYEDLSNENK